MHASCSWQQCCGHGDVKAVTCRLQHASQPHLSAHHRQQQQQQWSRPCVAVASSSTDTYRTPSSSDSPVHYQQQQPVRVSAEQQQDPHHHHQQQQQQQRDFGSNKRGRLLIKQRPYQQQQQQQHSLQDLLPGSLQEVRGSLPRGVLSLEQQQQQASSPPLQQDAQQHHQHKQQHEQQHEQHEQQQVRRPQQSLRDKNLSFSGALRSTKTLPDLIYLLRNRQWGRGFGDLDGVSVVGALVWLVKSPEWQQLQQEGSVGQEQWQTKRAVLGLVKGLLDQAESLVSMQNKFSSSSSSCGGGSSAPGRSAAAAAAASPSPVLIRPAELSNLIYCCSKLEQQRPQLLAAAAAGLVLDLYACSTLELQRLIWGLAHARVNPGDAWLLNFCKAAQAKLFDCSPAKLSALVYGVARLGYRPPDAWVAAWLEASVPLLDSMNAQQLANTAWGLSCFRFQAPPGWLAAFYAATAASMQQQDPKGFSQLAVALVTLAGGTAPPEDWTQQLLQTVQPSLRRLELLQLCNLGKALANWQCHPHEAWMGDWLDASLPLLPAATPVDLSVLLWSCYKLSYIPQQRWLEAWFGATAASLPRCEPQQLATLALVLGSWGLVPAPGFSIDFWRASRARFRDFTPYQMSVLLWGLGKVRRAVPATWTAALLEAFTQQLTEADPGDVCSFVGALSRVVVKPQGSARWVAQSPAVQQQLQQVAGWLVPQMGQVEPGWILQIVPGLAKLRVGLSLEVVEGLNDAAARMDERLNPGQRKTLAGGFGVLRQLAKQQQQQQPAAAVAQGRQQQQQQVGLVAQEWLPEGTREGGEALW